MSDDVSTEILNAKTASRYSYDNKKDIADEIVKLKPRIQLKILQIIKPEIKDYTANNNGFFTFFHDFSDEMYDKISDFIQNTKRKKHEKFIQNLTSDFSETINNSDNIINNKKEFTSDIIDTIEIDTERDLNNKERLIMRRKKYEEYLIKNQEE